MSNEVPILTITAASIGFFHTLLGPDHYLPFIVMARARQWSIAKTGWITVLCGIGHIGSSVVLGLIGAAFGIAVIKLEFIESFRGNLAAWALIAFGLVYFVWGLRRAGRDHRHDHFHRHDGGITHTHTHTHGGEHVHVHERGNSMSITPWILFTIFVLGPCEPLIPVLMYPAAKESILGLLLVTAVFGGTTIVTMLGIVLLSTRGLTRIPLRQFERYTHALAGGTIFLCGMAITFLGV